MSIEATIVRFESIRTLCLFGDLAHEERGTLARVCMQTLERTEPNLIVDLSEVTTLYASCIDVLGYLVSDAVARANEVAVVAPNDMMRATLEGVGFGDRVRLVTTYREAVHTLQPAA